MNSLGSADPKLSGKTYDIVGAAVGLSGATYKLDKGLNMLVQMLAVALFGLAVALVVLAPFAAVFAVQKRRRERVRGDDRNDGGLGIG